MYMRVHEVEPILCLVWLPVVTYRQTRDNSARHLRRQVRWRELYICTVYITIFEKVWQLSPFKYILKRIPGDTSKIHVWKSATQFGRAEK